eukprot:1137225-Pelagomonas_calceolata.AAC.9
MHSCCHMQNGQGSVACMLCRACCIYTVTGASHNGPQGSVACMLHRDCCVHTVTGALHNGPQESIAQGQGEHIQGTQEPAPANKMEHWVLAAQGKIACMLHRKHCMHKGEGSTHRAL